MDYVGLSSSVIVALGMSVGGTGEARTSLIRILINTLCGERTKTRVDWPRCQRHCPSFSASLVIGQDDVLPQTESTSHISNEISQVVT